MQALVKMNKTQWENNVDTILLNTVILTIVSVLSILGASIIILTFVIFKDIRTPARHIIVCIALSDLISSLSNCFGLRINEKDDDDSCIIQSFIGSTFIMSSFLWTMFLAVYLYIVIVYENQELGRKIIFPWFHIVSWFVPLAINIVAVAMQVLGNSRSLVTGGWCWIKYNISGEVTIDFDEEAMWMLIDGKGIEMLTYVVILSLYITIKYRLKLKIRNYSSDSSQFLTQRTVNAAKKVDGKLALIPICFIFLRIWGTIRFFMYIETKNPLTGNRGFEKFLLFMHSIGDNSLGAVNCILFCFLTPKVCHQIKVSFLRCRIFCRKQLEPDTQRFLDGRGLLSEDCDDNSSQCVR